MFLKAVLLMTVVSTIVEGKHFTIMIAVAVSASSDFHLFTFYIGIEVRSFTNRLHGIGGRLFFNDANTFTITEFTFDGQGLGESQ